jgi:hypothetical protein
MSYGFQHKFGPDRTKMLNFNITVLDNDCISLSSHTFLRTFSIVTTANKILKTLKTRRFGRSFFLPQVLLLKIQTSTCWPWHFCHIKPIIWDTKPVTNNQRWVLLRELLLRDGKRPILYPSYSITERHGVVLNSVLHGQVLPSSNFSRDITYVEAGTS